MFKCLKCKKGFQYESEYIRHKNKKKDKKLHRQQKDFD